MQSVTGVWYGIYHYLGRHQGQPRTPSTEFRAIFEASENIHTLTGTIVDGNYLGEADIKGTMTHQSVRFIKRYKAPELPPGLQVAPIYYEGKLSADGSTLNGIWLVKQRFLGIFPMISVYGTWEAYRDPDFVRA